MTPADEHSLLERLNKRLRASHRRQILSTARHLENQAGRFHMLQDGRLFALHVDLRALAKELGMLV